MASFTTTLVDRITGCFLGEAIGDAVGRPMESVPADMIYSAWGSAEDIFNTPDQPTLSYTDDTQMMIGVAEALLEVESLEEEVLVRKFASNFDLRRRWISIRAISRLAASADAGSSRWIVPAETHR